MTGTLLGIGAAIVAIGAWAVWMRRINAVSIPYDRRAFLAVCGLGVVLGIAALAVGTGIVGKTAAVVGILAGGSFVGLRALSRQQERSPAIAVGGALLDFSALDEAGQVFELSSLRGKPLLLKFFRGHW
jgi:hypothetical protein